jgi:hypothetical protein
MRGEKLSDPLRLSQYTTYHLSRDTAAITAPPKKKARKEIAGIVTDWESHRKPTLSAATSLTSIDADEDSMIKQGGMVSDGEFDDAEREAIAKGPTAPQKGGKGKLVSGYVTVIILTLVLNNLNSAAEYHQD